ncbi:ADP-ribosyltransferase [Enterococcus ratti]|uniref:ADP-ribosyltransferase n=1 Tax=Enterococcus ratti TaxID=150033 RepID=UPI0035112E0F
MQKKFRIFFVFAIFLIFITGICTAKAYANDDVRPDYKKDEHAAKEYGDKKANEFKEKLTKVEKGTLVDITRENYMNLKELNRRFDTGDEIGKVEDLEDYLEIVEELETLFDKKTDKTTATQYIYSFLSPENLGFSTNDYFDNSKEIDQEKFVDFINSFQYFHVNGYVLGDLYQRAPNNEERIIMKLKVPRGTEIMYLGGSEILLNKDIGVLVDRISLVNEGRQYIKIEAELVPEEVVIKELQVDEKILNDRIKYEIGIDENRIHLEAKSFRTNLVAERAKNIIDYYFANFPSPLLKEVFTKKLDMQSNYLQLNYVDKSILSKEEEKEVGHYNFFTNEITVDLSARQFMEEPEYKFADGFYKTAAHELGHAVDCLLLGTEESSWSETDRKFINLYLEESKNLTNEVTSLVYDPETDSMVLYGTTESAEYFAEVFSAMYSSEEHFKILIWELVPNTCKYIEEKMKPYM